MSIFRPAGRAQILRLDPHHRDVGNAEARRERHWGLTWICTTLLPLGSLWMEGTHRRVYNLDEEAGALVRMAPGRFLF